MVGDSLPHPDGVGGGTDVVDAKDACASLQGKGVEGGELGEVHGNVDFSSADKSAFEWQTLWQEPACCRSKIVAACLLAF